MKKEDIYKLLSLSMSIGNHNDYLIFGDEKLMNYSVSLVMEIDELLDSGYTYKEVVELIDKSNFSERDLELSTDEATILKQYAYHLLDIRYDIYMNNKREEKTKKHLFNK